MTRLCALLAFAAICLDGQTIRDNPGFRTNSIPRNDDGSGPLTPLGFAINFFGKQRTDAWVNNNGNITFDSPLSTYTPFGLLGTRREIVAAFFADVDTRPDASSLVTYGRDEVDGRRAFGANYVDVGFYQRHGDKLNRFQIVLIERADTGEGNFDLEFNYERIVWETGDASGGTDGFGGVPASVGWSNGVGDPGTSFELAGSLVSGALLDGGRHSLVRGRLNSPVQGRYVFRARGGELLPPLTIITPCPLPPATAGQRYLERLTSIGGGLVKDWSIEPDPGANAMAGLSVSPGGVLTGVPARPRNAEFTLRVGSVSEGTEETHVKRCSLRVDPPVTDITTPCPLPPAVVGQSYRRTLVATGGRAPWQWDLAEGSLAPGLTLDGSGVISGVPNASGHYSFLLRARSNEQDEAEPAVKNCVLTVTRVTQPVSSAACVLSPATAGVPYSVQLAGQGTLSWSALDPLPPGLTLDASGLLEGTPRSQGRATFRVRSEDHSGIRSDQTCTVTVQEPVLRSNTSCPLPVARFGGRVEHQFTATGGDGSYTWTAIGALPPGLGLSADGKLAGTAEAAGSFGFRVLITDGGGLMASAGCNLSVERPAFSLTSCPLPDAVAGEAYSTRLHTDGALAPVIFAAAGALPPGLTLNAFGLLSGVPERTGSWSMPVRLTDARGRSVQQNCVLAVQPPAVQISSGCPLPPGIVGEAYQARLTASGGTQPHIVRVNGPLPPGLTLATGGLVTGIPVAPGGSEFIIEAADAQGRRSSRRCSMDVSLPEVPAIALAAVPPHVRSAVAGPEVAVEISRPYPLVIEAKVVMEVGPDTGAAEPLINKGDPAVGFISGEREWTLRLDPGVTRAATTIPTTGTVASSVTIRVKELRLGGVPVQPTASPRVFQMTREAPVITGACHRLRGNDAGIVVEGYSNIRRVDAAILRRAGSESQEINLSETSDEWFSSDLSKRTGGAFSLSFEVPPSSGFAGWALVLRNSQGESAPFVVSRCP